MAKQSFARILELEEQDFEPLQFLGEAASAWSDVGELEKARTILNALVALAPEDPVAHLGLANAFLCEANFREAEKEAVLALRAANASPAAMALAYNLQGESLIGLGKHEKALDAWNKAIRADPAGPGGKSAQQRIQQAIDIGLFVDE